VSIPRTISAASALSPPPGDFSCGSSFAWSAMCDAGAKATVPRSRSSGVHVGASDAAHSAA
jgi:hypothetical protein